MAKLVLKDCDIEIDGVNLSNHARQATIGDTADEVEVTGFQSEYREFEQGLKDADVTVEFLQDFAAASVDATLFPLYNDGTEFEIGIKPTSDAVSATNPRFKLTAKLMSYSPIAGGVGEASTTDVTFRNHSQNGLEREIA